MSAFAAYGAFLEGFSISAPELGLGALALLFFREAVGLVKWLQSRKGQESFEESMKRLIEKMDRRLEFLENKTDRILEQGDRMIDLHSDRASLCAWSDAAQRAELLRQFRQEMQT